MRGGVKLSIEVEEAPVQAVRARDGLALGPSALCPSCSCPTSGTLPCPPGCTTRKGRFSGNFLLAFFMLFTSAEHGSIRRRKTLDTPGRKGRRTGGHPWNLSAA